MVFCVHTLNVKLYGYLNLQRKSNIKLSILASYLRLRIRVE